MLSVTLRQLILWAFAAILLTGCRFEADRDILAGQPTLPLQATLASLPATRYDEVGGTRAASLELTQQGLLEVTLFEGGTQKQQISLFALYKVPSMVNAVLGAETQKSGKISYYLFRISEDKSINFIDVGTSTVNDPRVLLYSANLWAVGIPQRFKLVDFSDESGTFRPSGQSEADFDAAMAARQQQKTASDARSNRQACLNMMAECPYPNMVCMAKGDEIIFNSVDGRFWYSYETGVYAGISGSSLFAAGPNCAMEKLVD